MNEELANALTGLIHKSVESVGTAKTFLEAEIPDVVSQLLVWHGVYNFILFCLGLLLISLIVFINYKQYKWITNKENNAYEWYEGGFLVNIFQFFWILPLGCTINFQWLKIWLAPKVWLIEYASKLVAGNG